MKRTLSMAFVILLLGLVSLSYALETATHEILNEYIARNMLNGFSLDSYLKDQLNIGQGIEQEFESDSVSYQVWGWLKKGGKFEDVPPDSAPFIRSVNHFHNPLNNEGFSGVWHTGFFSGESSIQWSQRPPETQCPGGYYSWHDVRGYFLKALTSPAKAERDENFARTFRGLGQLMHLVQDMSVPTHTRDDGHLFYNYETWAKVKIIRINDITENYLPLIFYSPSSIGAPNPLATVPFANLFDTNQYDGSNPDVTMRDDIGLSEFTNANFFSNDTIFNKFPYPDWSSVSEEIETTEIPDPRDPSGNAFRKYLTKDKHGSTGYRLSSAPYLLKYFNVNTNEFVELELPPILDDFVYEDYSEHLIPRAVGYSAGLIDYFFRGELDIKKVKEGFEITNTSKETMKNGHFELYYDGNDGVRQAIHITSGAEVPENNPINPDGTHTIKFTEPDDVKSFVTVYTGGLGNETNSVFGKVKPVNSFYLTLARSDGLVLKDDPGHGVLIQVYNSENEELDVGTAYNSEKKRWEIDLEKNQDPYGFYLAYDCSGGIRTEYKGMTAPVEPFFIGEAIRPSAMRLIQGNPMAGGSTDNYAMITFKEAKDAYVDTIQYWPITIIFNLPDELDTGDFHWSWSKVVKISIWQQSKTGELVNPAEVHKTGFYNDRWEMIANLSDPDYYTRSHDYKDFSFTLVFHVTFDNADVDGYSPITVFGTVEPGETYTIPIPYIGNPVVPGVEKLFKPEYERIGWEGNIEYRDIKMYDARYSLYLSSYSPESLPDIVETDQLYIFTKPDFDYRFKIDDKSYEVILPEDEGKELVPVMYQLYTKPQVSTDKIRSGDHISWNEYNENVLIYAWRVDWQEPEYHNKWIYLTVKGIQNTGTLFKSKVPEGVLVLRMPYSDWLAMDFESEEAGYFRVFSVTVSPDEWLYDMPDMGDGNLFKITTGVYPNMRDLTILRHISSINAKDYNHTETGAITHVAVENGKIAIYPKPSAGTVKLKISTTKPSNDYPVTINQPYLTLGTAYTGDGHPGIVDGWGYKVPSVVPEGKDFYYNFRYTLNHGNLPRFYYIWGVSEDPVTKIKMVEGWKNFYPPDFHFVGIGVPKKYMHPSIGWPSDNYWGINTVGAVKINGQWEVDR